MELSNIWSHFLSLFTYFVQIFNVSWKKIPHPPTTISTIKINKFITQAGIAGRELKLKVQLFLAPKKLRILYSNKK